MAKNEPKKLRKSIRAVLFPEGGKNDDKNILFATVDVTPNHINRNNTPKSRFCSMYTYGRMIAATINVRNDAENTMIWNIAMYDNQYDEKYKPNDLNECNNPFCLSFDMIWNNISPMI